jgi:hypothetical protein
VVLSRCRPRARPERGVVRREANMTDGIETPQFRVLSRPECELRSDSKLGRPHRLRARPSSGQSSHHLRLRGHLVVRPKPPRARGSTRLSRNFQRRLARRFEVDEIEGFFRWRSVVVHGNLHAASEGDAEWQRNVREWEEAMRSFRTLMPEAFTETRSDRLPVHPASHRRSRGERAG